jgi:hypothetical protein
MIERSLQTGRFLTLFATAGTRGGEWVALAVAQSAAFQVSALHAAAVSMAARISFFNLSWLRLGLLMPIGNARGRGRHVEPKLPLEASHPAAAAALRQMQRELRSRLLSTAIPRAQGSAAIRDSVLGMEEGVEGNLLLHYISASGALTMAAGWLGSGRRRYIWVPLRPTLAWNGKTREDSVSLLTPDEVAGLARDLHDGLTELNQRHVIEEFLPPDPIPMPERQAVLSRYTQLLESHGWTVTLDASASRRALKRTHEAEAAHEWSQADREELARLEALVAQTLKGVRTTSRILYQDK